MAPDSSGRRGRRSRGPDRVRQRPGRPRRPTASILVAVQLPPPPARSFASDNAAGAHPAVLEAVAGPTTATPSPTATTAGHGAARAAFRDLFGDVDDAADVQRHRRQRPRPGYACSARPRPWCAPMGPHRHRRDGRARAHPRRQADRPARRRTASCAPSSSTSSAHLHRRRPPRPARRRLDHPEHRAGHAVHRRRGRRAVRRRPPPRHDGAHGRRPHRQRHGRARRRRAALRSFTVDAGVDVLTFGGTKNGLLGGEAVVFLRPELARRARVRPQAGHPAAVEDALRRRPVPRPARRTTAGSTWPATPTPWPRLCTRRCVGLPGSSRPNRRSTASSRRCRPS